MEKKKEKKERKSWPCHQLLVNRPEGVYPMLLAEWFSSFPTSLSFFFFFLLFFHSILGRSEIELSVVSPLFPLPSFPMAV